MPFDALDPGLRRDDGGMDARRDARTDVTPGAQPPLGGRKPGPGANGLSAAAEAATPYALFSVIADRSIAMPV